MCGVGAVVVNFDRVLASRKVGISTPLIQGQIGSRWNKYESVKGMNSRDDHLRSVSIATPDGDALRLCLVRGVANT